MKSLILVLLFAASLAYCQNGASTTTPSFGIPSRDCLLPADPGPCEGLFPKWYFNRRTRQCEEFNYGGCGGNANRFDTREECEAKCGVDICRLKPDPGPCEALIPRWFFNPSSGECEQFIYGGCEGNANNFETRRECQEACRDDCDFVACLVNPCEVIECPAFPNADCVPNFCTGCDADFFVNGRLVDCGESPPACLSAGEECQNPDAPGSDDAEDGAALPPCCDGLQCCACGPPVVSEDFVPPPFGTCRETCVCPIG